MKTTVICVILVAVWLAATTPRVSAAETCSVADGPVWCDACREGGDINFVSSIPRYNQGGTEVSSNLGDFDWVKCNASGFDCKWWDGDMEETEATSPASYVQGTGAYVALTFIMAPLSFLCLFMCTLCRMCGCCGGWSPSFEEKTKGKNKGKKKCCGCGFRRNMDPTLEPEDSFTYPFFSKLCARICMAIFVILTFVFIIIGQQMGNVALTDAAQRLSNAPDATVATVRKLTRPAHRLVVGIASNTLVPTLQDINATLLDAIDLDQLINSTSCVADKARSPPGLAELLDMVDTVLGLKTEVDRVDPIVIDTINVLSGVSASIDDDAPQLQELLANLSASRTEITASLTALDTQLGVVEATVDILNSFSTGLPAISGDLGTIGNPGSFPTEASADAVANGGADTATLQELLADSTSFDASDFTTLTTDITNLGTLFQAVPNTTVTADNIDNVNAARISFVDNDTVNATIAVLDDVKADLDKVPGSAAATGPINNMLDAIMAVNTSKIDQLVVDLNNTVNSIPDPDRFAELVDEVFAIADLIPCIDDMTPIIDRVNETLVSLPSFVDEILNTTSSLKDDIDSARSLADDAKDGIVLVKNNSDAIDFTTLGDLTGTMRDVQNSSAIEFNLVLNSTADLDSATNIDFGSVTTDLQTVEGQMTDADIVPDPVLLADLRSFDQNRTTIMALIPEVVASITLFAQSRCQNTLTTCTSSSDCGGNPCLAAQKQCSAGSDSPGSACTGLSASECTNGYCLFEAVKYTALREALDDYAPPTFNVSTLQASMNSLLLDLADLDLAAPRANVTKTRDDLLAIDISGTNQTLNDAIAEGDSVKNNVESTNSTWAEVRSSTKDVPDPSSVQGQLNTLNDTAKELDDIGDKTRTFVNVLNASRTFLYDTLPPIFESISEDNLEAAYTARGLVGTYEAVMDAARNITEFMEEQQGEVDSVSSSGGATNYTLTRDLRDLDNDALRPVQVLSEDKYFANGPYYFIASLLEYDTVEPDNAKAFRVYRDIDGNKYPNDDLCVLTKCITNEVEFVNREPLSDVLDSFDMEVPMQSSLFLTREQASGIPYIFPALAALLGLLGAVICCPKKSKCQRVPLCLSGCCLCVCIPLTFLFISLPFLMVMISGDFCRGAANVGYHVVSKPQYMADACDAFGADVSLTNPTACNISIGNDEYSQLDMPLLVQQLLGTCDGTNAVWNDVLLDVQDTFVDIPVEEVNKTLDDMTTGDFVPRQRIRDDIVRGAQRLGQTGRTFIGDVNDVLTCTELNGDIVEFKEAICCDVMSAFYWSIMSWNVLAWVMLCCGCPACCLGWKRFPARPWGKTYKKLVKEERDHREAEKARAAAVLSGEEAGLQMVPVDTANIRMDNPMRSQQPPRAGAGAPPGGFYDPNNPGVPAPVTGTLPAGVTTPAAWAQPPPSHFDGKGNKPHARSVSQDPKIV